MIALQRIKHIQDDSCDYIDDINYLVRAFQVMREIAIEADKVGIVDVDQEFEERMKT